MNNKWTLDETLLFTYQISKALYELSNENIIHLDLKPDNILLKAKGQYLLCDFGCARNINKGHLNKSMYGMKVSMNVKGGGTPEYSSPDLTLNQ